MASSFYRVEAHPDDRPKTGFLTSRRHVEYLRIPMGIKNLPATFQRLMDAVLKGIHGIEVFVYLEDIGCPYLYRRKCVLASEYQSALRITYIRGTSYKRQKSSHRFSLFLLIL